MFPVRAALRGMLGKGTARAPEEEGVLRAWKPRGGGDKWGQRFAFMHDQHVCLFSELRRSCCFSSFLFGFRTGEQQSKTARNWESEYASHTIHAMPSPSLQHALASNIENNPESFHSRTQCVLSQQRWK